MIFNNLTKVPNFLFRQKGFDQEKVLRRLSILTEREEVWGKFIWAGMSDHYGCKGQNMMAIQTEGMRDINIGPSYRRCECGVQYVCDPGAYANSIERFRDAVKV